MVNSIIIDNNFDIVKEHFGDTQVKSVPIYDENQELIDGFKLLRRTSDESNINIVSNDYQLVQHKDYVLPFIERFFYNDNYQIEVGIENEERRNRAYCKIVSNQQVEINGDNYSKVIFVANSADGSMSKKIMAGLFRWQCENMQFSGTPIAIGNSKHISADNETEEEIAEQTNKIIEEMLNSIEDKFQETINFMKHLSYININQVEHESYEKLWIMLIKAGVPKTLKSTPLKFFETNEIFVPACDIQKINSPEKLFDIYQTITLWSTNKLMEKDITTGVNVNKRIAQIFNQFVHDIVN